MKQRPLLWYFILAFAITWGLALLLLLFPVPLSALFGPLSPQNPLFILAVFAPTISALIVTARTDGQAGLRELLARLLRWRFHPGYYAFVLLGMPLLAVLACWLSHNTLLVTIPALLAFILSDPGPLGEELGWRGFALPRLLQTRTPLQASLILGLIWGIWHLPAFLLSGLSQSGLSLPLFLLGALALTIIATWLYLGTHGSVLITILMHMMANLGISVIARNFNNTMLLLLLVALGLALLLWRQGRTALPQQRPIQQGGVQ